MTITECLGEEKDRIIKICRGIDSVLEKEDLPTKLSALTAVISRICFEESILCANYPDPESLADSIHRTVLHSLKAYKEDEVCH